jgi:hypothetical protein
LTSLDTVGVDAGVDVFVRLQEESVTNTKKRGKYFIKNKVKKVGV